MAKNCNSIHDVDRQEVLNLIAEECGIALKIAQKLGINRESVRIALRDDPEYSKAMQEARQFLLEEAKSSAVDLVRAKNPATTNFILERLGKHEGFGRETLHKIEGESLEVIGILLGKMSIEQRKSAVVELKSRGFIEADWEEVE